jgi:hypothetical protein
LVANYSVQHYNSHHNDNLRKKPLRLPMLGGQRCIVIPMLHTLTPLGVAMAGANEFDSYKD